MFKVVYIIRPGDLVFYQVKVIYNVLIEDHPRIITVKFGLIWIYSIEEGDVYMFLHNLTW